MKDDVIEVLARKAKGDGAGDSEEASEDRDMGAGRYDKLLDSAADGILSAVEDGDRDRLKDELWDFVRACMAKKASKSSDESDSED